MYYSGYSGYSVCIHLMIARHVCIWAIWVYTAMHAHVVPGRCRSTAACALPRSQTHQFAARCRGWNRQSTHVAGTFFGFLASFFGVTAGGVLTCLDRLCSYQLRVTNPCKSGGLTKGVVSEQTMIVSRVYTRESRRQSKASCPLRPSRKSWDLFYPWRVSQHLFPS